MMTTAINFSSLTLLEVGLILFQPTTSYVEESFSHYATEVSQENVPKETNLKLDEDLAGYINAQARLDEADQVILLADSIIVTERITLREVDVIFVSNYFSTDGNQVSVLPAPTPSNRSGVSGKSGKEVQIIANHIGEAAFHLPGMDGTAGRDGSKGKNGDKSEVKNRGDVSMGTAGEDGQDGGSGGKGGQLILHSQNTDYPVQLTAPGGDGKAGGFGGTGGTTFIRVFTQTPGKPKKPDPNLPGRGGNVQIQSQNNQQKIKARQEEDGKNGKRGRNGLDGEKETKILSDSQFEAAAREHYLRDWQKLDRTGWQIIFREE
ncbi:hypothetical protein [Cyclobacterium plantarum]|uniref:Collagen-like protein n=1 Tax=Cyclobacterium plantarum TaxID=2716263 RepID=A0ABX0HBR7_9BACT|nr:hypothetical protein [Cyclobacterium plantarum]NHE59218.1 hypothetical protein [Cyclobacterium plantarum]